MSNGFLIVLPINASLLKFKDTSKPVPSTNPLSYYELDVPNSSCELFRRVNKSMIT
ncbi:hypothetical protein CHS0354_026700, partial [Potamilus streckersoni]